MSPWKPIVLVGLRFFGTTHKREESGEVQPLQYVRSLAVVVRIIRRRRAVDHRALGYNQPNFPLRPTHITVRHVQTRHAAGENERVMGAMTIRFLSSSDFKRKGSKIWEGFIFSRYTIGRSVAVGYNPTSKIAHQIYSHPARACRTCKACRLHRPSACEWSPWSPGREPTRFRDARRALPRAGGC